MPKRIRFKTSSLVLGLLMGVTVAQSEAQFRFALTSAKGGAQIGPKTVNYGGGTLRIDVLDGSVSIAGCVFNGTTLLDGAPFPPSQMPPCPLGTTGFIALGDIDFDGMRDDGSFWSLANAPVAAAVIAPFRPDKVRVVSAPPSLFPRPGILPVTEGGAVVFYNVLSGAAQTQYDISGYVHEQTFLASEGERVRHDETVVTGLYTFSFPRLIQPDESPPVVVSLSKLSMPESWPGLSQSPLDSGFRFTNDDNWSNGAIEFDPRDFNDITWQGIDGTNFIAGSDVYTLWIQDVASPRPLDLPPAPPFAIPLPSPRAVFPPSGNRMTLTSNEPLNGRYRLPAFFFQPGDERVLYLRLQRTFRSTAVTFDTSVRAWTVPLRFVDTYGGFTKFNFPVGTSAELRAPHADFDGDGFSNLIEFALSSDHTDPLDVPDVTPPNVGGVAPGTFSVTPLGDGRCQVSLGKRPNVGGSLIYYFELSPDMVNWTRIPIGGDADWVENVNDATTLQVTSVAPIVPGVAPSCFFRVAVEVVR